MVCTKCTSEIQVYKTSLYCAEIFLYIRTINIAECEVNKAAKLDLILHCTI